MMTFDNIHRDTQCKCLADTVEDTASIFTRRLRKSTLSRKDFLSHWERGKYGKDPNDCEEVCKHRALSFNKFTPESESQIRRKYRKTFTYAPGITGHFCKFRLKKDAGKVKATPSLTDRSHYAFYKSDTFSIEKLEVANILSL